MRIKYASLVLASAVALGALSSPAYARDDVVPFIRDSDYKKNISPEAFRSNPRVYYRSENAFQLSRQYLESVIGQSLTSAEFISLLKSDQVRAVSCIGIITTGGMLDVGYHWLTRPCRSGEMLLQVLVNGVWTDFMSLNCLNTVEDKKPTPPPVLTYTLPPAPPPATPYIPPQKRTYIWETPGAFVSGTVVSIGQDCPQPLVIGTPSISVPGSVSTTTEWGY